MTAHMYGCEMRCLVVELNISCVFGTDGGNVRTRPGLDWGGQRPSGVVAKCKRYSNDQKGSGARKDQQNATYSTRTHEREGVRSVRLTGGRHDDNTRLT